MSNSPTINGHPISGFGCVIDGHWGQYGPDRLADIAEEFGYFEYAERFDPRVYRAAIDDIEACDYQNESTVTALWDSYFWAVEAIEVWLESQSDGVYLTWEDGEFFFADPADFDDGEFISEWADGGKSYPTLESNGS